LQVISDWRDPDSNRGHHDFQTPRPRPWGPHRPLGPLRGCPPTDRGTAYLSRCAKKSFVEYRTVRVVRGSLERAGCCGVAVFAARRSSASFTREDLRAPGSSHRYRILACLFGRGHPVPDGGDPRGLVRARKGRFFRPAYTSKIGFSGGSVVRLRGADATGNEQLTGTPRAYCAADARGYSWCLTAPCGEVGPYPRRRMDAYSRNPPVKETGTL
jgi:hypothetical protein